MARPPTKPNANLIKPPPPPAPPGVSPKNVGEIVKAYLEQHGLDGLYLQAGDCGCELKDLTPAGEECMIADCVPARKGPCDPEDCPCDGTCDWHMYPATGARTD